MKQESPGFSRGEEVNDVQCVDCLANGITTSRPIHKDSGPRSPRCATHIRAKRKAAKLKRHANHVEVNFGITGDEYWYLYEMQGGVCFICGKAKGIARRLAVDHEHHLCDDHPPDRGCPACIRMLGCSRCNQMIGWLNPDALRRAIIVLEQAPARKWLADRRQAD